MIKCRQCGKTKDDDEFAWAHRDLCYSCCECFDGYDNLE